MDVQDWRRKRIGSAAVFEIEPSSGPVGTVVNIYGRFRPKSKGGTVECSFQGTQPVSPDYMSTRRMILVVPDGAKTGAVRCAVGREVLWAGHFAVTSKEEDIFVPMDMVQGLLGAVYPLPPNTQKLPDFEKLGAPVATFVVGALQIAPRPFKSGFPKLTTKGVAGGGPLLEWFAIRFTGLIEATKTAEYTFRLLSDDGAKLYIDNKLVIDNDGIHPPQAKEGKIKLTEGKHDIVIEYFQGPKDQIALDLKWKRGNNPFTAVPAKSLSRHVVEHDCSEKPAIMCCRAQTPACQDCVQRAQVVMKSWEQQCKR